MMRISNFGAGRLLRLFVWTVLLTTALSTTSCRRAAERAREKIRVEAVERITLRGLTAVEAVIRVQNGTGYKLVLDAARVDLCYAGDRVAEIRLRDRVEVGRRTVGCVVTQWQVRIDDPLAFYALVRSFRQGDLSQVTVSYAVEGRGGPASANISRKKVPLSEILTTFGLTSEEVSNYLKFEK